MPSNITSKTLETYIGKQVILQRESPQGIRGDLNRDFERQERFIVNARKDNNKSTYYLRRGDIIYLPNRVSICIPGKTRKKTTQFLEYLFIG